MYKISLKDRDDYLILDDGIGCADDGFEDSLFTYGDAMENKWPLTIEKIRANKVNLLETVGTVNEVYVQKEWRQSWARNMKF